VPINLVPVKKSVIILQKQCIHGSKHFYRDGRIHWNWCAEAHAIPSDILGSHIVMSRTADDNVVEIGSVDGNEVEQHQHQDDPTEHDRFPRRADNDTAVREPVDRRAVGR